MDERQAPGYGAQAHTTADSSHYPTDPTHTPTSHYATSSLPPPYTLTNPQQLLWAPTEPHPMAPPSDRTHLAAQVCIVKDSGSKVTPEVVPPIIRVPRENFFWHNYIGCLTIDYTFLTPLVATSTELMLIVLLAQYVIQKFEWNECPVL